MLGGEDLRRRHHGPLPAILDGLDEREHGDDRLARADVALHKAVHRHRPLHVAADLLPRLLLVVRRRRAVRKSSLDEFAAWLMADAALRLLRLLL